MPFAANREMEKMADPIEPAESFPEEDEDDELSRLRAALLASFAIGAAVGFGLALVWVPERRRGRFPPALVKQYERARKAGSDVVEEIRRAAGEATDQLRDELAIDLEAAREELVGIARDQMERLRKQLGKR